MKVTAPSRTSGVTIKVNNNNGVLSQVPGTGVTLNNLGSIAKAGRLDGLADVVEGPNPEDGSVLVYNAADDKYYVRSVSQVTFDLDGGNF